MLTKSGLGKTIEAGIVISQYWSERKRDIPIIAPSSLRQQWQQELHEIPDSSALIDAKTKERILGPVGLARSLDLFLRVRPSVMRLNSCDRGTLWSRMRRIAFMKTTGLAKKVAASVAHTHRRRQSLLLTATPFKNNSRSPMGLCRRLTDYFRLVGRVS